MGQFLAALHKTAPPSGTPGKGRVPLCPPITGLGGDSQRFPTVFRQRGGRGRHIHPAGPWRPKAAKKKWGGGVE